MATFKNSRQWSAIQIARRKTAEALWRQRAWLLQRLLMQMLQ
jgi:hypothetical protein